MPLKNPLSVKPKVPPEQESQLALVPGAEPSTRLDPWWWLVVAVVVTAVVLITFNSDFQSIFRFVADGLLLTIILTIVAYFITLFVGILGGLGRTSKNRLIYGISSLYVEIVRGIPLLVQLIMWFYVLPAIIKNFGSAIHFSPMADYNANPILMAILGLVFCYGAYMSEIFRAGIQSVPKGQMEAARSLGMSYLQAMRHIVLPQAFRIVTPPVGNEFISLLKDTSLVSALSVDDLTRRGREYASNHFSPIETYTLIALLYLVMTLVSARLVAWLEKRARVER